MIILSDDKKKRLYLSMPLHGTSKQIPVYFRRKLFLIFKIWSSYILELVTLSERIINSEFLVYTEYTELIIKTKVSRFSSGSAK